MPSGTAAPDLPRLTGLRWVAALLVFTYHAHNLGFFAGDARPVANVLVGGGATGVSFFFILSGFVLAWSTQASQPVTRFWRARVARVWPLHLVTAAIAVACAWAAVPGLSVPSRDEALANMGLVSSWNHDWWQAMDPVSWSLSCEALFYLVFPLVFLTVCRASSPAVTALAVLCVAAVLFVAWSSSSGALLVSAYDFPLTRLPEFVLGVSTGLLVRRDCWRGPSIRACLVLTAVGFLLAAQVPRSYSFAACTVLGFALLVPAAAKADLSPSRSVLCSPGIVRLGQWSFAFYLVHLLVLRIMVFAVSGRILSAGRGVALVLLALAISLICAWALHVRVEVPARRLLLRSRGER